MSTMNTATFSNIEEIGFRVKASRLSRGLGVSSAHKGVMTHVAYTRSEEGRGSLSNLVAICDVLNLTVETSFKSVSGEWVKIPLAEARDAVVSYREASGVSPSDLARDMSVPYASVRVFESSDRPQVRSISRYAQSLGMEFKFAVSDVHGEYVIPSKRLNQTVLAKLEKDLHQALNGYQSSHFETKLGKEIKKIREKKNMTKAEVSRLSGIGQASVAKVENSRTTLETSQKVVEALGKQLFVVFEGDTVPASEIHTALDRIRCERGITPSDFARRIGTTYRAVMVFPKAHPTVQSISRYAHGLGVEIRPLIA